MALAEGEGAGSPRWHIAVHGGAGAIAQSLADPEAHLAALRDAVRAGAAVLSGDDHGAEAAGGGVSRALRACLAAVVVLEDCPLFNAGRGATLTRSGVAELEASVVDGATRRCGACCGVRRVKNPVLLAARIMTDTPHCFLGFDEADRFGARCGLETCDAAYFITERRVQQLREAQARHSGAVQDHDRPAPAAPTAQQETVGAVAVAPDGSVAAATSTGGRTNKWDGRIGDTPLVGAGSYASGAAGGTWRAPPARGRCARPTVRRPLRRRTVACSGTGYGEAFIRLAAGASVCHWVEYAGLSLREAVRRVVHEQMQPGDGGFIACSRREGIVVGTDLLLLLWLLWLTMLRRRRRRRGRAMPLAPAPIARSARRLQYDRSVPCAHKRGSADRGRHLVVIQRRWWWRSWWSWRGRRGGDRTTRTHARSVAARCVRTSDHASRAIWRTACWSTAAAARLATPSCRCSLRADGYGAATCAAGVLAVAVVALAGP